MLINGLNSTWILIALVLVLLQNSFLYCPRAAHLFSKETRSVKSLLLGQSKTSYYIKSYFMNIQYIVIVNSPNVVLSGSTIREAEKDFV
jgi:hypothetical protein